MNSISLLLFIELLLRFQSLHLCADFHCMSTIGSTRFVLMLMSMSMLIDLFCFNLGSDSKIETFPSISQWLVKCRFRVAGISIQLLKTDFEQSLSRLERCLILLSLAGSVSVEMNLNGRHQSIFGWISMSLTEKPVQFSVISSWREWSLMETVEIESILLNEHFWNCHVHLDGSSWKMKWFRRWKSNGMAKSDSASSQIYFFDWTELLSVEIIDRFFISRFPYLFIYFYYRRRCHGNQSIKWKLQS